jgi:hypothetical protein
MIEKKLFCEILESIQIQMIQDREVGSFFYASNSTQPNFVISYNTNRVIKSCVKLLQQYFPRDKEGFCAIEHYCFFLEFGKPSENGDNIETFEQLYKRLINNL